MSANKQSYLSSVSEDRVFLIKRLKSFQFRTSLRCQNFGEVYLMNPQGISIRNEKLESQFEELVFPSLVHLYDGESSLVTTTSNLGISSINLDYEILSEDQIGTYCEIIDRWLDEVEVLFFEPMMDVNNIAIYISKYSYPNSLNVMVGGNFPVMQFKKLFILYIGGQMERYYEYKVGLKEQIESLPLRKPAKSEEAKIYLENFYFIVQELEGGKITIPA